MEPIIYGAIVALVVGLLSYVAAIKGIRRAKDADRDAMIIAVRAENREDLEGVVEALGSLVERLQAQLARSDANLARSEANNVERRTDIRELRLERTELRKLLAECTSQCKAAYAELKKLTGQQ